MKPCRPHGKPIAKAMHSAGGVRLRRYSYPFEICSGKIAERNNAKSVGIQETRQIGALCQMLGCGSGSEQNTSAKVMEVTKTEGNAFQGFDGVVAAFSESVGIGNIKHVEDI